MRYTSINDAIDQAITPALGEYGDDYDLDAIAREAFEYKVDTDKQGNELLNTAGFEQIVDDAEFWAIAEKHDITIPEDNTDTDLGTTAWLGVQNDILVHGDAPEIMILNHQPNGSAPEAMPATSLPVSPDAEHEVMQDAAEAALKAAGWETTGEWDTVDSGYTVKVRPA